MYKSLERTIMEMGRPKVQPIVEDGHQDVASAKNKVKIAMSALQKMQGELNKLSDEDNLPSWWMGKVAIAVDKLDGMADYLDTQVEDKDLENVAKKLKGASKTHSKQADTIMKHVKDMEKIDEGMMKNMAIDLKDLPSDEFQRKYNMSKAEAERRFGKPEVKSAPKGYHFTRDGKLKKGDADADGDGGAKLRSDPLDKQRSKIPPLPEKIEEARDPSMTQVMAVMAPTKNAQEGVAAIMKAFKVDEKKAMKLLDAAIKDVLGEKFANPAQQAAAMAAIKKSGKYKKPKDESIEEETLDELSIMTLNRYYKKALAAIHKSRKSHDASIMRGMDPSKDKATISKRAKGVNLAKSRALKKIRGEEVNEDISKMKDSHVKFFATKNISHPAYTRSEIDDEHRRRQRVVPNYHKVKPSMNEDINEAAPKPLNRSNHTHTVHIDGEGQYKVKARSMDHAKKIAFKQAGISKLHGHPTMEPKTRIYGEEIEEKTLTPAEKKKREEVAKAIERENPNMPMDQKMAIATATAKKVAEDVQTEPATNTSLFHNYIQKLVKGEV